MPLIQDIKILHPVCKGVSYLPSRQFAKENGARLPFSSELGAALLDDKTFISIKKIIPAWVDTGYALGEKNGVLPKGVDITDFSFPNLVLPAEYVKLAAQLGDLEIPNSGIIYNIAEVEQSGEKIIFHPSEIFVHQFLAETGWGKIDLETYVASAVSKQEMAVLDWTQIGWFGRVDLLVNRPFARGDHFADYCGRRYVSGKSNFNDDFGVGGVKLDAPSVRLITSQEKSP